MIYIDPPYNTGNDFLYNDKFEVSEEDYKEFSGDYDEYGQRMTINSSTNGRYHTDWLNKIYSRLVLAKDFLSKDGAIFISIDDNEQSNLKRICDEVFGERNFVTSFIWAAGRKNDSKLVSVSHEYILCYVRSIDYLRENSVKWRERKQGLDDIYAEYDLLRKQYGSDDEKVGTGLKKWFKSLDPTNPAKNHKHYCNVDFRGPFFAADISWPGGGGPRYEVLHPTTKKPVKVPSGGWRYNKEAMDSMVSEDRISFGQDHTTVPCVKRYLKDHEYSAPYSVFYKDGRAATKRLRELLGNDVFQNPKDEEVIQSLIQICTDKDSIIMDFYSGSATTAHSVFLQNELDGGNRSFILVQLPEPLINLKGSSGSSKEVYNNAVELVGDKPHNVCEIGKERIRRAGMKINEESGKEDLDIGFRVFKLDTPNFRNVSEIPENTTQNTLEGFINFIEPGRGSEDLLIQVMLQLGIELSAPIAETTINGHKVFDVDDGYMIACFDDDMDIQTVTEISKKKSDSAYAVFFSGPSMTDDVLSNIEQIFKTYSPQTKIRIL